ncbi:UDP-glucuronosyl/UDP-glucosyltransferase, partial [Cynara cardunculus var. scolymus]
MAACHVVFFPFTAYGHLIPMADMAVLFASRGLQTTIITTPFNVHRFSKSIQKTTTFPHQIALHIIEGYENSDQIRSDESISNESISNFRESISMLQEPVEQFIQEYRPNCLIADMFYPWTTKMAAKFDVPRIVFHGSGFFPLCASESIRLYEPHKRVSSDSEPFIIPHLPHEIKLTRKQLPDLEAEIFKGFVEVIIESMKADETSYGVIFNSFNELEPEYVRHYREVMKRKAWHIGPVSLCNKNTDDKLERGKKAAIKEDECLRWLDLKPPNSVVYLSFGTLAEATTSQLHEIAMGLEACNENFIWVIKNEREGWMPEGFEARMKVNGKGLIITGWAPQTLILDHESVGVFVTHCGWNSVLEGISSGVAMVTWPVMAEQFYNAKLVTDILQIGVSIGDTEWSATASCDGVKREAVEKVVAKVMSAEEGEEMRKRARVLKEKAKMAVEDGGS